MAQDVITTWPKIERLVYKLVWQFVRRHGGDFDDLFGECQLRYVKAYDSFDPSRGFAFSTWLTKVLWRRMSDVRRNELRRPDRFQLPTHRPPDGEPEEIEVKARRHSGLHAALEGLSDDALEVLDLTTLPPPDITLEHRYAHARPDEYRSALYGFLTGMGWTPTEIAKAFCEIADALRDLR